MSRRVERVCVVGRDAPAWIAAASVRRALGASGVEVRLVELPSLLQAVDCYAAVPSLRGLHQLLGLDEAMILRAGRGVPMVAQRFSNWSGAAPPFFHAYDTPPPQGMDLDFRQYWLKGHIEGLKVPFDDFSLGAAAAMQGRVPHFQEGSEPSPLRASFGYHLDARGYTELLSKFSRAIGVDAVRCRSVSPEIEGERIAALALDNGERIEADLFIDASGAERALIGNMPGAEFDGWGDWFGCNRILAASAPRLSTLPAFSQVSAFRSGWIGLFPLQDRTAVVAAYDSTSVSDDELVARLPVLAGLPISGDAVVSPFESGMVRRPWVGNCVAVGEAAVAVEPLDAVQLHAAQGCVSHLMTLFPVDADFMPEAQAYARVVAEQARGMRDFQLAHYKLNKRFDAPFWDRAREATAPDTLAEKVRLFEARGLLPTYDEESFDEPSWAASFLGHGVRPEGYDPRVDKSSDEEHVRRVQGRLREVAALVMAMPTVDQFLADAQQAAAAGVGG